MVRLIRYVPVLCVFLNLVQRTEGLTSAPRSEDFFMQGGGVGMPLLTIHTESITAKLQPWFLSFRGLNFGSKNNHLSSYWPKNPTSNSC